MIEIGILTLEESEIAPLFRAYPPETARRLFDSGKTPLTHIVLVEESDIDAALESAYAAGNHHPGPKTRTSHVRKARSTSVGDLLVVMNTGAVFLVASFGFEPMFTLGVMEVRDLRAAVLA